MCRHPRGGGGSKFDVNWDARRRGHDETLCTRVYLASAWKVTGSAPETRAVTLVIPAVFGRVSVT